jgi:hypothetical protein
MRRLLFAAMILGALLCWNPPTTAHHASAWFDLNKEVSVVGKITRVEWVNPHILVYVEGNPLPSGKEAWVLQGFPPNNATRNAVTREKLQLGTVITARVYPPRDSLFVNDRLMVTRGTAQSPASATIVEAGEVRLSSGEVVMLGRGPGFKGY